MKNSALRRFWLGFVLTFGLCLSVTWAWTAFMQPWFMNWTYDFAQYKYDQLTNHCHGGEIVILGDSLPATGLDPDELGQNVINLAIPGSSPIENYFAIRKLARCSSPPAKIILSLAGQHLEQEGYWWLAGYLGILDFRELEEVRQQAETMGGAGIYTTNGLTSIDNRITNALYATRFPAYFASDLRAGGVFLRSAENQRILDDLIRHRGLIRQLSDGSSFSMRWITKNAEVQTNPLLYFYFKQLLSLLDQIGAPVCILDMPLSEHLDALNNKDFRISFERLQASAIAPYPNIRRCGPLFPVRPDSWFGIDATHLSLEGARMFSREVRLEVRSDPKIWTGP